MYLLFIHIKGQNNIIPSDANCIYIKLLKLFRHFQCQGRLQKKKIPFGGTTTLLMIFYRWTVKHDFNDTNPCVS